MIIVKIIITQATAAFISVNTAKYGIKILKRKEVFVLTNNKTKTAARRENSDKEAF